MERGIIEIAPLAYMRGRTLDDAFVILDEAQNTTVAQMKNVFDSAWLSVKNDRQWGHEPNRFTKRDNEWIDSCRTNTQTNQKIDFVNFEASDVVRHPVVAEIIKAYEKRIFIKNSFLGGLPHVEQNIAAASSEIRESCSTFSLIAFLSF